MPQWSGPAHNLVVELEQPVGALPPAGQTGPANGGWPSQLLDDHPPQLGRTGPVPDRAGETVLGQLAQPAPVRDQQPAAAASSPTSGWVSNSLISTTSDTWARISCIALASPAGVLVKATRACTPSLPASRRSSASYGPVPTISSRAWGRASSTWGNAASTRWWPL